MNLLTDDLFEAVVDGNDRHLSLPVLLESLGRGRVQSLNGVQRHQEDAIHVFLCCLAAAVLHRAQEQSADQPKAFWEQGLRDLAMGDEGAWSLVVADPAKPAFMQPPVVTQSDWSSYSEKARTPDDLDTLQTAKNHDLKKARLIDASEQEWMCALISLQTTGGFLGQGNYGIARMNGGFASRPFVALRCGSSWSDHFQDETIKLLDLLPSRLNGPWGYRPDGIVLTWLEPWDGLSSIGLPELHPFFIEVCRAVRLVKTNRHLVAFGRPTKSPRIGAKDLKGTVGDPWIPVNSVKMSALTVPSSGFTPKLLRNLLFQDGFDLMEMQRPGRSSPTAGYRFYAAVLVRGQGTTDGFHEVSIPVPLSAKNGLFGAGARHDELERLSKDGLEVAGQIQWRVLRPALYAYLEAGRDDIDFQKKQITEWVEKAVLDFVRQWEQDYFLWLWNAVDGDQPNDALVRWIKTLKAFGLRALSVAMRKYPGSSSRRYRARVNAQGMFAGAFSRQFPSIRGGG